MKITLMQLINVKMEYIPEMTINKKDSNINDKNGLI
jgi:hypothetical protein